MSSDRSLTPEQEQAISRLFEHDETILVAPTGAGKTVICLTAVKELLDSKSVSRVIVAAPAKVIETMVWPNEAAKWKHLRNLRIIQLDGDSQSRTKALLSCEFEIMLVSLNNLEWLLNQDHDADGIIIDELSRGSGRWTKGLRSKKKAGRLVWRVGLTATPVSQDFQKLYGMARVIDHGKALGTSKQKYLEEFFYPDYHGYNWTLKDSADAKITAKVASLVHLMADDKAETLPSLRESTIKFDMPPKTREIYNQMKKDMVVGDIPLMTIDEPSSDRRVEDNVCVFAANQAVKSGKLRQIAAGFLYDQHGISQRVDVARFTAASIWWDDLRGKPGLIFYEFVEQGEVLRRVVPENVDLAQVTSMSHGVEGLQHTYADALFLQPVWSRDAKEQAIGRIWRQGQTKPVTITTLVCENTLDQLVMDRVHERGEWMELFKQHLKGT